MTMPFPVYDYAGPTLLAQIAGWTAFSVACLLAVLLVAMSVRSVVRGVRLWRFSWLHLTVLVVAAYLLAWLAVGPELDHEWWYLQENVKRSYSTYRALAWATAFFPPLGGSGRGTFVRLATRDSGFAKGQPYKVEECGRHVKEFFRDEDYGEVVALDGRPVFTGTRFASTRKCSSLVPLFEVPTARKALLVGPEAEFYAAPLKAAGVEVQVSPSADDASGPADFVLVCLEPEWMLSAERLSADQWERLSGCVDRDYGAVALHVDARLLPAARAKGVVEEFRSVFPSARLWCTGRFDWVLVGFHSPEPPIVRASAVLKMFEREEAFDAFLDAGVNWAGDFLANYVGSLGEVTPALEKVSSMDRRTALRVAPRLAFEPPPSGDSAQLKPGDLLPLKDPDMSWFRRGDCEEEVFSSLTGRVADVQWARRVAIAGMADADAAKSDSAIEKWGEAARVNTYDPVLKTIADSMDLEGRRRLRVGDHNGAMRCFENRILVEPDNIAAIHNFGVSVKKSGRMDLATQVFLKAVSMEPNNDELRLELIECASAGGNNDLALQHLDVLIQRHPGDVSLKRRRARIRVHEFVTEADRRRKESEDKK